MIITDSVLQSVFLVTDRSLPKAKTKIIKAKAQQNKDKTLK